MNSTFSVARPHQDECRDYFWRYIDRVDGDDIIPVLADQPDSMHRVLGEINESESNRLHSPYTWSIKQVVGHLIDTERVFGYRACRFATGDATEVVGFDQDQYVDGMDFALVTLAALVEEFNQMRASHLAFFRRLGPEQWDRRGSCEGAELSVRAIAYIMAGHVRHHMDIVRQRVSS